MEIRNELKSLAASSATAENVLIALAQRGRDKMHVSLKNLKHDLIESKNEVNSDLFMYVFKKLEELGVGRLVRRHGVWVFEATQSLRQVAETALDKTVPPKTAKVLPLKPAPAPEYRLVIRGNTVEIFVPEGAPSDTIIELVRKINAAS